MRSLDQIRSVAHTCPLPPEWAIGHRRPTTRELAKRVSIHADRNGFHDPDERLSFVYEAYSHLLLRLEFAEYLKVGSLAQTGPLAEGAEALRRYIGANMNRNRATSGFTFQTLVSWMLEQAGLKKGIHWCHAPSMRKGPNPDFVFPARARSTGQPVAILEVKTKMRERWHGIEANLDGAREARGYLLTVDIEPRRGAIEGLAPKNGALVAPAPHRDACPPGLRGSILTVSDMLEELYDLLAGAGVPAVRSLPFGA